MDGIIDGFTRRSLPGDGTDIDALVGGSGPPLLLLHGWPETRICWSGVGARLMESFTLVIPDLRGYGRSPKPKDDGDLAYSKRSMAADQIASMHALGFDRFAVAGHDRGARVAYRLALDHPESVSRLAVLDIVPTADVWSGMAAEQAVDMWHWPFLAQPDGLPERMIGADPGWFVRYILTHQGGEGFAFPSAHLDDYISCAHEPATVAAWCADYRAGWSIDRTLDEADRGSTLELPLLVLWGETGSLKGRDGVELWRAWAADVRGEALPCGHFVPEEQPDRVASHFLEFFSPSAS